MSQAPVAVVTDSTAALSEDDCRRWSLNVLPMHVQLGALSGLECDEVVCGVRAPAGDVIAPVSVASALRARTRVTTSQVSAEAFAERYRKLLDSGAAGVVSVHLSAELSGTYDSARAAALEVDARRIRVVDSRSVAMGIGFGVRAAARAAATGADLDEVAVAARRVADVVSTYFYVDSLEWLHRGGRIGAASALLGGALSIKPLLGLREGAIVVVDKVRTASRALTRLVELSAASIGDRPVDVAVHHLDAPGRAEHVAGQLRGALPSLRSLTVSQIGGVVGAHAGPGVVGVVTCPLA